MGMRHLAVRSVLIVLLDICHGRSTDDESIFNRPIQNDNGMLPLRMIPVVRPKSGLCAAQAVSFANESLAQGRCERL
jgi:hypothetical protein